MLLSLLLHPISYCFKELLSWKLAHCVILSHESSAWSNPVQLKGCYNPRTHSDEHFLSHPFLCFDYFLWMLAGNLFWYVFVVVFAETHTGSNYLPQPPIYLFFSVCPNILHLIIIWEQLLTTELIPPAHCCISFAGKKKGNTQLWKVAYSTCMPGDAYCRFRSLS